MINTYRIKTFFSLCFNCFLHRYAFLFVVSSNTTVYGTTKVNEGTELIVVIGMCVYLLMANVLLLNMLIAVFK